MHKIGLLILIVLMGGIIINANDEPPSHIKIYEGTNTEHFFWSADSTTLYFIDYGLVPKGVSLERGAAQLPVPAWVAYNVYDQTLHYSDTWFEQPEMSDEEYTKLGATHRLHGEQTLFFANPEGTLHAFAQYPHDNSRYATLAITDGTSYVSTETPFTNNDDLRRNQVLWNETGTSLITYSFYDISPLLGFVTDFQADSGLVYPTGVEWWRADLERDVLIESTPLQSPIYDLSNDQSGVLMLVGESYTEGKYIISEYFPMIWHPLAPEKSEYFDDLKNRDILAGIFAPDDESQMLFVDETGLILYDRETGDIQLIDETINLERIWLLRFSPDGRWLFYYDLDEGMIIVDVISLLSD